MFFHGVMIMSSLSLCSSIRLCSSALMCQLLSPTHLPSLSNSGNDFSLFLFDGLTKSYFFCPSTLLIFFSPPFLPTAFGFLFSDKCGFSTERLILNERRDSVENVAGTAFLLAADRVQTGSYIGLDYIIGDTGISQGRYAKNCLHCLGHCA